MTLYTQIQKEGRARRGRMQTKDGIIETPAFMNVGTCAAIKGAVSSVDLKALHCQIELCNTYHLHLRPGSDVIKELGGLNRFMGWDGPTLTDSGGFQVFSLSSLRNIQEEGVYFQSHIDGRKFFMDPEESMQIQSNLGSTIAMAFDECVQNPASYPYAEQSCKRTIRWLRRCQEALASLNQKPGTLNPRQLLFGINQGATFEDLRIWQMKEIAALSCDGYAIGGLAVGEPAEEMYRVIDAIEPFMPADKPRYLMGVGKPGNILEAVARGIDLFDCVMPSRNARHGHVNTYGGILNLMNAKYQRDDKPIDPNCSCPTCQSHSRAYLRHLFKANEMLASRLAVMHNLYFYNTFMEKIRACIEEGTFSSFYQTYRKILDCRIEKVSRS